MKKRIMVSIVLILILLLCENFSIVPSAAQDSPQAFVGSTERVSVSSDGRQGNKGGMYSSISADGRYVVFTSESFNLVAGDTNGFEDVFVYDRQNSETTRVSVSSDGTQGNGDSSHGGFSADGRYVAFTSSSTNLVDGDTTLCYWRYIKYNCSDVFVHDRVTGETTMVSLSSDGTQANWNSYGGFISANGRYVVFTSFADNLVVDDGNFCFTSGITSWGCPDVFVHDRLTGETNRVSVASDGTERQRESSCGSISEDGNYVVFTSFAGFVAEDTDDMFDVYIHDQLTGETTLASVASDGQKGNGHSGGCAISADGLFIPFSSASTNLVAGDSNNVDDVFMRNRETGETTRVSIASDGTQGNGASAYMSISADGRYVTFDSKASNLVNGDVNNFCDTDYDNIYDDNCTDIFIHDRIGGETTLVSVAGDGTQGNNYSNVASISADGRYVTFASLASNLVRGDSNLVRDIFVRDRESMVNLYSISGYVTDASGNPLPGVSISAGNGYSAITDSQGEYTLSGLQSGTYWITSSLSGYLFIPIYRETSVPPERLGVDFSVGFPALFPIINR